MVKESEIQNAIMDMLLTHPRVVFSYVTTSGTVRGRGGGRFFKVGFNGLSDIMGMEKGTGRLIAIEVKQPGKEPTDEQYEFLETVRKGGGIAGWADSVDMAMAIVEAE